ncbi:MAG TPA: hypothetical protein VHZ78_15945 [Rhizomicrobium sp.]|jgi:hypothetical protein|nr:hypothetical protein [Rhizomicrobium sp.]
MSIWSTVDWGAVVLWALGAGLLAYAAVPAALAWSEAYISRRLFAPSEKIIVRFARMAILACGLFIVAWHLDTAPLTPCGAVGQNGTAADCPGLMVVLTRLDGIEQKMAALNTPRRAAEPLASPGTTPPPALSRNDWMAIADHTIDRAHNTVLSPPSIEVPSSYLPWLMVVVLAVLAFYLWQQPDSDKWARNIAKILAVISVVLALANCIKAMGEAGAAWAWAFAARDEAVPPGSALTIVPWPHLIENASAPGTIAAIPIFFENAREATLLHKSEAGANIDDGQHEALASLIGTMLHCADADHHVALAVRGFSSAADFQASDPATSNSENLDLANRRAVVVREALLALIPRGAPIDVTDLPWARFDTMAWNRPFGTGLPRRTRDALNRAALIGFAHAGRCSIAQ